MKAIITVGISASGKSTFAEAYARVHGAIVSNRDDLRFSLTGARNWSEYKFNAKIENLVTRLQNETALEASKLGKDFIVADTNIRKSVRDDWIRKLKFLWYEVELKLFPIELEEAIRRNASRKRSVEESVIREQYQQWLEFKKEQVNGN